MKNFNVGGLWLEVRELEAWGYTKTILNSIQMSRPKKDKIKCAWLKFKGKLRQDSIGLLKSTQEFVSVCIAITFSKYLTFQEKNLLSILKDNS